MGEKILSDPVWQFFFHDLRGLCEAFPSVRFRLSRPGCAAWYFRPDGPESPAHPH